MKKLVTDQQKRIINKCYWLGLTATRTAELLQLKYATVNYHYRALKWQDKPIMTPQEFNDIVEQIAA